MSQIPLDAVPSTLHAANAFVDMRRRKVTVPIALPVAAAVYRIYEFPCSARLHGVKLSLRDAGATGGNLNVLLNGTTILENSFEGLDDDGDVVDGTLDTDLLDANGGILIAVGDVITASFVAVDADALDATVELDFSV